MATWRLKSAHYLIVPDTEWEYKETDRQTGKQARKVFKVPRYLNPEDPADYTHREQEAIIVAKGGNDHRALQFEGPPTPEMEPLDDEAKKLTEAESAKWVHPIESLPGQGYNASLLTSLEQQLAKLVSGEEKKPVAVSGITPADFKKLQDQLNMLVAKNAELEAQIRQGTRK